ncbi:MAG TPA: radical SAM protein [bacterium (Candidatus Stahlbacteria)]|nr:radical SAM protein [Candidatus Stahlbacteria bacterium]
MNAYPRWIEDGFEPFDPLELAAKTKSIVCKGDARKYTHFYCTGVYGGISTGYTVGCLLRCIFCWVDLSREFPESKGELFTPEEVFNKLINNAKRARVSKLRISGGEPTLGEEHLLRLLDLVDTTNYLFILETNGILFGANKDYVEALKNYKRVHVRISLKAGTPEGFEERTGAKGKFYELPFQGIKNLIESGIRFHVAVMSDPRLMPKEERNKLKQKLREFGYTDWLEEEMCDPYDTTLLRLQKAGWLTKVVR